MFAVIHPAEAGWYLEAITAVSAGVVLLLLVTLSERKAAQPIRPLRPFASCKS